MPLLFSCLVLSSLQLLITIPTQLSRSNNKLYSPATDQLASHDAKAGRVLTLVEEEHCGELKTCSPSNVGFPALLCTSHLPPGLLLATATLPHTPGRVILCTSSARLTLLLESEMIRYSWGKTSIHPYIHTYMHTHVHCIHSLCLSPLHSTLCSHQSVYSVSPV